jgi:hypothetical protein
VLILYKTEYLKIKERLKTNSLYKIPWNTTMSSSETYSNYPLMQRTLTQTTHNRISPALNYTVHPQSSLYAVFSTNQVRLPYPFFPHVNITHILYFYISIFQFLFRFSTSKSITCKSNSAYITSTYTATYVSRSTFLLYIIPFRNRHTSFIITHSQLFSGS